MIALVPTHNFTSSTKNSDLEPIYAYRRRGGSESVQCVPFLRERILTTSFQAVAIIDLMHGQQAGYQVPKAARMRCLVRKTEGPR